MPKRTRELQTAQINWSESCASGMTDELAATYSAIKDALPQQREQYAAYLDSLGDDYKAGLTSGARALGLSLDLPTGRIMYSDDFDSKRLPAGI